MPIAEIINEIDAYLSRLRQARELLLGRGTEAPQNGVHPRKTKATVRRPGTASSIRRRGNENKSPSNPPVAHLKTVRSPVDARLQVPSAVAAHPSHSERAKITEPKPTIAESIAITRLPARRRLSPVRSVHPRIAEPSLGNTRVTVKPAIALAGPMNSKIVVVSAEQAQKEREQAARPANPRPRRPASGLTGRSAFEALFEEGTKPSRSLGSSDFCRKRSRLLCARSRRESHGRYDCRSPSHRIPETARYSSPLSRGSVPACLRPCRERSCRPVRSMSYSIVPRDFRRSRSSLPLWLSC